MRAIGYALIVLAVLAFAATFTTAALGIWFDDARWGNMAGLAFMFTLVTGGGGSLAVTLLTKK